MSTNGDAEAQSRVITKVVITYHTEGDPTERTLTMEHGGRGEVVDGIVWSDELMKKIAYLEGDGCVEPKKGAGTGEWNVYSGGQTSDAQTAQKSELQTAQAAVRADCVWIHDFDCMWWSYCPK